MYQVQCFLLTFQKTHVWHPPDLSCVHPFRIQAALKPSAACAPRSFSTSAPNTNKCPLTKGAGSKVYFCKSNGSSVFDHFFSEKQWIFFIAMLFDSDTLPETNIKHHKTMKPENRPSQKEISSSNHPFSGAGC